MENRHRPRLLIADDHTLIAEACTKLLEPEFEVIAIVSDGLALLKVAEELSPDVIVVDIGMPQLNGLDAGEQIKRKHRSVKLIYLTMDLRPEVAAEAFRRGASGYVVKHCTGEELIIAVRRVLRGESYLSSVLTKETVDFLLRTAGSFSEEKHISSRQSEVLQLLAEGKSMKEIAYILRLKYGTVAFHKYKIMEVLGLKSNADLVSYAMRHHMLSE